MDQRALPTETQAGTGPYRSAALRSVGLVALGVITVGVLLVGDSALHPNPALSAAYLLPVAAVAWLTGRSAGAIVAIAAAVASGVAGGAPLDGVQDFAIPALGYGVFAWVTGMMGDAFRLQWRLARTDPVTAGPNRRAFDEQASTVLRDHERLGRPLTVVCLDVDDFKAINDRCGHAGGDAVLRCVGETLAQAVRRADFVSRYGGDEFAVLLPDTDAVGAERLLGRLRTALDEAMAGHGWAVTFSIGAVTFRALPRSQSDLMRISDERMYAAKRAGKNRVLHEVRDRVVCQAV